MELQLSGLIGTARHPDRQKMHIIGIFNENMLYWQYEVRLLPFTLCTFVKTFGHALFDVLEAIRVYCAALDPITGNFKAS